MEYYKKYGNFDNNYSGGRYRRDRLIKDSEKSAKRSL
jgi:hypothetical protein